VLATTARNGRTGAPEALKSIAVLLTEECYALDLVRCMEDRIVRAEASSLSDASLQVSTAKLGIASLGAAASLPWTKQQISCRRPSSRETNQEVGGRHGSGHNGSRKQSGRVVLLGRTETTSKAFIARPSDTIVMNPVTKVVDRIVVNLSAINVSTSSSSSLSLLMVVARTFYSSSV
jgi:hypothetical protein